MNRAQAKRYKLHGSNARIIRGPSRDEVLGRLQTLPRGDGVLILENLDHPRRYVQVLLQRDGLLRLEVRDDDPVRHLMTRALSVERVADAFDDWMTEVYEPSRTEWRDAFQWHDISDELRGVGQLRALNLVPSARAGRRSNSTSAMPRSARQ